MRIITGRFKGRKLVPFNNPHVRPTTDREKETIFNKLMAHIEGARVADLFAGTGSLGLEALSRGASLVEFVEKHPASLKILRQNLDLLKIQDEVVVTQSDVLRFLANHDGAAFDIILADPPFTEALADQVMESMSKSKVCAPGTRVIIESGAKELIKDSYGLLKLLDRRDFGDKRVSFYIFEGEAQ